MSGSQSSTILAQVRLVATALVAGLVLVCGSAHARAATFNPDPVFSVGPISDTTSHRIEKLESVAHVLAGRKTVVNCWSESDWSKLQAWNSAHHFYRQVDAFGVTWEKTRHIELSPFVCQVLAQVVAKSASQPLFTAEAVHVVAHESAHASGIKVESGAECQAIRTDTEAGRLLGMSKAAAAQVPHIYRGTIYPYMSPNYRSPVCRAGLPGAVVPDTLGSATDLRPLEHTGAAFARALSGWKNLEGAGSVGPLSPCSPIRSRTAELARFGEFLEGPNKESVVFSVARFKTVKTYATVLTRLPAEQRCDIGLENRLSREAHSPGTISAGRIPSSILRISARVDAFREIWTSGKQRWNRDKIFILDKKIRSIPVMFFRVPSGTPIALEVRAVKAALRASG